MPNVNQLLLAISLAIFSGRHLLTLILAALLLDKAPQTTPTSAMIPRDRPKVPPRGLQMAPRLVHLPPRWCHHGAKCIKLYRQFIQKYYFSYGKLRFLTFSCFRARLDPSVAHDGAKLAQEGSQEASRRSKTASGSSRSPIRAPELAHKTAQDGPQMGSRRARGGKALEPRLPCRK